MIDFSKQQLRIPKLMRPVYLVTAGQSKFDRAIPEKKTEELCIDALSMAARLIDKTPAELKRYIHTFMVCERSGAFNTLKKPIKFINVAFEGVATILMSYLSEGEPEIGKPVIPIFKTTDPGYTIIDLSWVTMDTPKHFLPEGFSF